jgi:serine acetyltransferase
MNLINLQKFANKLYLYKIPLVPRIIYYIQFILFNSSVPYKCKIGKNTKDIPSNCIVAGIPAKIIKTDIKMSDYV